MNWLEPTNDHLYNFSLAEQKKLERYLRDAPSSEDLEEAFYYFINVLKTPDFSGSGAYYGARMLWKSPFLQQMSDQALVMLAEILWNKQQAVHLHLVATLLSWFAKERVLPILQDLSRREQVDPGSRNQLCIDFVKAMAGDPAALLAMEHSLVEKMAKGQKDQLYLEVVAATHHPSPRTLDLFSQLLCMEEACQAPSEFLKLSQRCLFIAEGGKDISIVLATHYSFKIKDIVCLLPKGEFLAEFGHYPSWDKARTLQERAIQKLNATLSPAELGEATADIWRKIGNRDIAELYPVKKGIEQPLLSFFEHPAVFRNPF